MNNIIEQLKNRYTVRNFKDEQIKDEHLQEIKDVISQSPTGGNQQDFSVIIVKDQEVRNQLSILCDNQPLIKKSPMSLVFISDFTRYLKGYELNDINLEESNLPNQATFFLATVDAVIAAQSAVVACDSLGIGSCYIGDIIENKEEVCKLLNLEKHQVPVTMISIGYHDTKTKLSPNLDQKYMFFEDKYKQPNYTDLKTMYKDFKIPKKFEYCNDYFHAHYERKTNTEFYREMDRSIKLYLKDFD